MPADKTELQQRLISLIGSISELMETFSESMSSLQVEMERAARVYSKLHQDLQGDNNDKINSDAGLCESDNGDVR